MFALNHACASIYTLYLLAQSVNRLFNIQVKSFPNGLSKVIPCNYLHHLNNLFYVEEQQNTRPTSEK